MFVPATQAKVPSTQGQRPPQPLRTPQAPPPSSQQQQPVGRPAATPAKAAYGGGGKGGKHRPPPDEEMTVHAITERPVPATPGEMADDSDDNADADGEPGVRGPSRRATVGIIPAAALKRVDSQLLPAAAVGPPPPVAMTAVVAALEFVAASANPAMDV